MARQSVNDPLFPTLIDALSLLRKESLPCALIGGLAVSLRGQTRVTADVDFVVAASIERMLQLVDELDATQFVPLFDGVREVVEQSFILPLRHKTTGIKVDISIGISGFEQQAVRRAEELRIAKNVIPVASAEDLILMKLLADRPQDQLDVKALVATLHAQLDWEYCQTTAVALSEAIGIDLGTRVADLRDCDADESKTGVKKRNV
jgi:hypothetical protein